MKLMWTSKMVSNASLGLSKPSNPTIRFNRLGLQKVCLFLDNAEKLLKQEVNLDLPGAAQHYCLHCARYFIDERSLTEHFKTKVHKRRLKALELEPYSIEESERAAGHGNFKLPTKRKIVTQNIETDITDNEVLEDSTNKRTKTEENVA